MTLLLDKKAIIKKETNGFEIYNLIEIGPDVKNVTIKGGTLIGDRNTHDYSDKCAYTAGTHEWGVGIATKGPQNVTIEDISIKNFTGDGVEIGGSTIYGTKVTAKDLEPGGIDAQGKPIAQKGKIRSNNYDVTNFHNKIYQNPHYRNLMMWLPTGITGTYDLFYYKKDGTFIREDKNQRFQSTHGYSSIPSDADYFRVVFNAYSTKGVSVSRFAVAVTDNITIKNCDIGFNRRQAITVGASDGVQILNNQLHDTGGTAPGSGIDVEPGFFPAKNIHIKGNTFTNNKIQTVLAYGANVTIDENVYGEAGKGSVGLYIWAGFQGVTIKNNKFENGPGLYVNTPSTITNNTFINSGAEFKGESITIDGIEASDSKLKFDSTAPFGIKGSYITMKMTGTKDAGLLLNGEPLELSHVKLTGPSTTHPIGTFGSYSLKSGSIFDHVSVEGSIYGYDLPPGTYNDSVFIAASGQIYGALISKPGIYMFNHCTFKATKTNLGINNPDADVTIKESTFEELDPESYSFGIIQVSAAKNITLLNNSIDARKNTDKTFQPIKIGKYRGNQYPSQVKAATIKGNVIYSTIMVNGISTIDGGNGAPVYDIENNTLYNSKVYLKPGDVNKNNQELTTK